MEIFNVRLLVGRCARRQHLSFIVGDYCRNVKKQYSKLELRAEYAKPADSGSVPRDAQSAGLRILSAGLKPHGYPATLEAGRTLVAGPLLALAAARHPYPASNASTSDRSYRRSARPASSCSAPRPRSRRPARPPAACRCPAPPPAPRRRHRRLQSRRPYPPKRMTRSAAPSISASAPCAPRVTIGTPKPISCNLRAAAPRSPSR